MANNAVTLVKRAASGIEYWDARWYDHVTGKRRGKSLGRCDHISERQARKLMGRIEIRFEDNPVARSAEKAPTLNEWITLFIQRQEARGRKATTVRDYRTLKRLIEEHMGTERRIDTITKFEVEQFRLRLSGGHLTKALLRGPKRKLATSSVDKYMRNVRTIFTAAFDDDLIPRNPTRKLCLPPTPASEWHKVTPDEFWKLYAAAEGGMRTLIAICRLAALRYSDAMALKWSNVRFDEGVLVFRPGKVERFAKRDARVPICAELRKEFEAVRGASYRIDDFVVARDIPRDVSALRFPALFAMTGLTPWDKPLHTLRKSCIDDWTKVAPPNVVMEWATHSSLNTTMKYYSKVSPSDERMGQVNLFKPPASSAAAAS